MKKFFMIIMMLLSVVSLSAKKFVVETVKINATYTRIYCLENFTFDAGMDNENIRMFFNTLRCGDVVELETYGNKVLAARKVGYQNLGRMTNGVVLGDEFHQGYYGYYGVGGSMSVQTKHVGVDYNPYTGVGVRIGGKHGGFSVNLPVRVKSSRTTTMTANTAGVVYSSPVSVPTTTTAPVTRSSRTTTSKTNSTHVVKVYNIGAAPSKMF